MLYPTMTEDEARYRIVVQQRNQLASQLYDLQIEFHVLTVKYQEELKKNKPVEPVEKDE